MCDPGKYCDTPGLLDVRGPCDAGYLCHGGAYTSGPVDGVTGVYWISQSRNVVTLV